MFGGERDFQTICAVSTPQGVGGISVIRISGPQCFEVRSFLPSIKNKEIVSHKAYYSDFISSSGVLVDEVLATFFINPKSFTGEDVVEISCHGSPQIVQMILNQLVTHGFKTALPGEFTYRAFMNNKLDLVQAESVLDVIESNSQLSAQISLRQLKGGLSERLHEVESHITWVLAHLEASIDFSTEGLDVISNERAIERLEKSLSVIRSLTANYQSGKLIKEGLKVVLMGEPNVGKSSLLNLILDEEKAIVTHIPGTTRDVVSGDLQYKGLRFSFYDTAGLRESEDLVEKIGIQRSLNEIQDSDVVLCVFDSSKEIDTQTLINIQGKKIKNLFFLFNKSDLNSSVEYFEKSSHLILKFLGFESLNQNFTQHFISLSTQSPDDRSRLLDLIYKNVLEEFKPEEAIVINSRHYENLCETLEKLIKSIDMLKRNEGAEFVALYLRDSLLSIMRTLGKSYDDQIMDRVFKEFCIGK